MNSTRAQMYDIPRGAPLALDCYRLADATDRVEILIGVRALSQRGLPHARRGSRSWQEEMVKKIITEAAASGYIHSCRGITANSAMLLIRVNTYNRHPPGDTIGLGI